MTTTMIVSTITDRNETLTMSSLTFTKFVSLHTRCTHARHTQKRHVRSTRCMFFARDLSLFLTSPEDFFRERGSLPVSAVCLTAPRSVVTFAQTRDPLLLSVLFTLSHSFLLSLFLFLPPLALFSLPLSLLSLSLSLSLTLSLSLCLSDYSSISISTSISVLRTILRFFSLFLFLWLVLGKREER